MDPLNHHLVRAGLRVPDIERSAAHAVEVLGLDIVTRDATQVALALPGQDPCLILRAADAAEFDFMALRTTADNLAEIRNRLQVKGIDPLPAVELDGDALRVHAPNGVAVEVGVGAAPVRNESPRPSGPVIGSLDHLSFSAEDPGAFRDFFIDVLGFRLSDSFLDERHWLRCNPNHHTVAVFSGRDGLHHYAFETADIRGLAQLGDLLAERAQNFIWGPGRHGLGQNIFTYHLDPAGSILEVTSDMLQIESEAEWEAEVWTDAAKSGVLWGPMPPTGFRDLSIPAGSAPEQVR
ncbi:putative extradiol dioxygenase [Nocardia nova SH22a]|uniref:Putative extradiol dioxygenase n=1 Tax=Nocardia nova SH22a TaxID=1415166 RepID=W5TLF8_9NOCA|nr:VOC family protein [Nocardia nova]AHH19798.1 putative extradiol dioxygenase [Nocardia nova SH22a]